MDGVFVNTSENAVHTKTESVNALMKGMMGPFDAHGMQ